MVTNRSRHRFPIAYLNLTEGLAVNVGLGKRIQSGRLMFVCVRVYDQKTFPIQICVKSMSFSWTIFFVCL